jgi:hypothetical protein
VKVGAGVGVGAGTGVGANLGVILAARSTMPAFSWLWLPSTIPTIKMKQETIWITAVQSFIVTPIRLATPPDQTMKLNNVRLEAY